MWIGKKVVLISMVMGAAFMPFMSCTTVETSVSPEKTKVPWEQQTPKDILDRLIQEQNKINDLSAAFSIAIDPPPRNQPSNFRGLIFFARHPEGARIRIKGLGPFGRVYFDMLQQGRHLQVYIPSRQTLYKGRVEAGKDFGSTWQEIFSSLFVDFSGVTTAEKAELVFDNEVVVLPLVDGELRFDRHSGYVLQWLRGETIVNYGRYRFKSNLPALPTEILMESDGGRQRVICKLYQEQINQGIDEVFDLSGYKPRDIKSLGELDTH